MTKTFVTVEPEQLGMEIQEGRISAKEITESSQFHVIDPKGEGEAPAAVLFIEADGLWAEVALHAADAKVILSGLEEVVTDAS